MLTGTEVSTSIGKATTEEANTGAASKAPIRSQTSKSPSSLTSTTWRKKSIGLAIGTGDQSVIKPAEVNTQPVPANPSKTPKVINRRSPEPHKRTTSRMPTQRPVLQALLTRYKPVAKIGATIRKPEKAPASSQNLSLATQRRHTPNAVSNNPCSKPGTGLRRKSAHPNANQRNGEAGPTVIEPLVGGMVEESVDEDMEISATGQDFAERLCGGSGYRRPHEPPN
ncbi:MAG: hypothetical protein R3E42_08970 [Burkholderiaceae bacterium]